HLHHVPEHGQRRRGRQRPVRLHPRTERRPGPAGRHHRRRHRRGHPCHCPPPVVRQHRRGRRRGTRGPCSPPRHRLPGSGGRQRGGSHPGRGGPLAHRPARRPRGVGAPPHGPAL